MTLAAHLAPAGRAALAAHLDVLRHDLGKYVTLQVRWSGGDPEALHDALAADLLSTRRGPSGSSDAVQIWEELAPELRGERALPTGDRVDLRGDVDFDTLEAAMCEVRGSIGALRSGRPDREALARGAVAARTVGESCRRLWARSRE